ncbi:Uncharacterized protein QTN25_007262 [Entamoeba marina]
MKNGEHLEFKEKLTYLCFTLIQTIFTKICQFISNFLFGTMLHAESIDNNIIIFDDEDILDLNNRQRGSDKFLNYIDHDQFVKTILKYKVQRGPNANYTVEEILKSKDLNDLIFDFDTSDYFVHKLNVYNIQKDPNHLICQLFLRVSGRFNVFSAKKILVEDYIKDSIKSGNEFVTKTLGKIDLDLTIIDWLRLQDYRRQPSKNNMILPNQIHPGLGIGHEIEEFLLHIVEKKGRDGLMNTPEHWYNAYIYYTSSSFHFLNPAFEGFFRSVNESVRKDIQKYHLATVAWAIAQGKLYHIPTSTPVKWVTQEQICPVSKRMKAYFGKEYIDIVMRNYHPKDYFIKWDDNGEVQAKD